MNYTKFIEQKLKANVISGFDVDRSELHPDLMPHQVDLVSVALKVGRYCIWADTGLGKAFMGMEWASHVCRQTGRPVLIVAPLGVAHQLVEVEAPKFGYETKFIESQDDIGEGIHVTNYEKLDRFNLSVFSGVVLDECFPPDTLIDTNQGQKAIKDIKVGDYVLNASGYDLVADVHRREIKYAVKVTIDGKPIISSPNHPYFTQRGWVGAQDLIPSDKIVSTRKAMQMVQSDFFVQEIINSNVLQQIVRGKKICQNEALRAVRGFIPNERQVSRDSILREILLSEMADESAGKSCKSPQSGSGKKERIEQKSLACIRTSQGGSRERACSAIESNAKIGVQSESIPNIERDGAQTFRAWGQWDGNDAASADFEGCSVKRLDCGIRFITGQTDSRLSNSLQDGLRESRSKNLYRSGWNQPPQPKREGSEEGSEIEFYGVDSLEILEPGHPELEKYRDADGSFYFYDIGATRHPSFSINGCLVHNSSILKAKDGKTRQFIIDAFSLTPYKLACSATPAPNDHIELGNQCEFVGALTMDEMLAEYFIHDGGSTQNWRLKGHAQNRFWEFVSSWASYVSNPSQLGYNGDAYVLPPIEYHEHMIGDWNDLATTGELLRHQATGLSEQRSVRSSSLQERCSLVKAIIDQHPDEIWLIWCETNAESALISKLIDGVVEVKGADTDSHKKDAAIRFGKGEIKRMISKASIFGFGMNFQQCHNVIYLGVSHSFEQYYQSIRRVYRFGQKNTVNVHVIQHVLEGAIIANLKRKELAAAELADSLSKKLMIGTQSVKKEYAANVSMKVPTWISSAR